MIRGLATIVGVTVLTTAMSGCDLLTLLGDPGAFDPDAPYPTPDATWVDGTATLELGETTIVLDDIVGAGTSTPEYGIDVTWTNGEGWYLAVYTLGETGDGGGEEGYIALDRLVDAHHWVVNNSERCITTLEESGPARLSGTAICRGLVWADYFGPYLPSGLPARIDGEPAFDLDIEFEARCDAPSTTGGGPPGECGRVAPVGRSGSPSSASAT